jgi:hypothetical protein
LGYYKFHTDIKTWDDARVICENEGAHLAVLNSLTEAKALPSIWIRDLFNDWRKDAAYIGAWDPKRNGDFVTIFSKCIYCIEEKLILLYSKNHYHPHLKMNIIVKERDVERELM